MVPARLSATPTAAGHSSSRCGSSAPSAPSDPEDDEGVAMTESAVTEPSVVRWNAPSRAAHPARDAAFRSYDAVIRKDKDAWLANFADDGWIEDPVGPSMFDEEGKGHHGADE